jgi:tRNA-Thr(GGU) m(6)t(6)A37 methyltransferase TsaA
MTNGPDRAPVRAPEDRYARPVTQFVIRPVAHVESPLVDRAQAPMQGDEGAPDAWLVFDESFGRGLLGLHPGTDAFVLTWLHQADREVLVVYPRGDVSRPETGVFSTRSPDRPNPIGLHRVRVLAVDGLRVQVAGLEAIDGTPVVDVKPVLGPVAER